MKNIAILGATGSIGEQTLAVVETFPDRFAICALSCNQRVNLLQEKLQHHQPDLVAVADEQALERTPWRKKGIILKTGQQGLIDVATHPEADLVVNALPGSVGLIPTLKAIEAGKSVALANKEALVMAGEIVTAEAHRRQVDILPIDSEQCALHQCLLGRDFASVERLIITASGGPFLHNTLEEMAYISPAQALNHPVWNMGPKVTIDSATLMNKAFEVMEAHWLFNVPTDRIEVIIHPQAIIHSMVEFVDGSVLAQLGVPDMQLPILYALSFPDRLPFKQARLDFTRLPKLEFISPDLDRFPCLDLGYQAAYRGQICPAVVNAADEVAIKAFLDGLIGFTDIPGLIRSAVEACDPPPEISLEAVLKSDTWSRAHCAALIRDPARIIPLSVG